MLNKDFNILGTPVDTANSKKDISFVSDINSYVQKIENICRLQKGEIPSLYELGVNYYDYIFDQISNKSVLEENISSAIKIGINDIIDASVQILSVSDEKIIMQVFFTTGIKEKNNLTSCKIEVDIV